MRYERTLAEQCEYLEEYQRELTAIQTQPQASPLSAPGRNAEALSLQALLECLENRFRSQDLKEVYFLMSIGYDDLVGGDVGKSEKAMALIEYAETRERLTELLTAMQEVYPGLKY